MKARGTEGPRGLRELWRGEGEESRNAILQWKSYEAQQCGPLESRIMDNYSKKKARERFFIEEAAKRLGKSWNIGPDREHPDFLVADDQQRFGLEVSEIFTGPQDRSGASMKRAESITQQIVNDLRREYEAITDIPLRVKFVGDLCAQNLASVVPALVAEDLAGKPVGHHVVIDEDSGLRVHVTRAFRNDWFSVNDRAGWVDRRPTKRIADAIEKKSRELSTYAKNTGPDVRLLLVADRIYNSGKVILEEPTAFDLQGFRFVYFFSYPESVVVLKQA